MDKHKLIQQYLDGDLSPEEEREALHLFADDAGMRTMLRFEQKFRNSFRNDIRPESFEVPHGFSDRVMYGIQAREKNTEAHKAHGILEKVKSRTGWLWKPQPVYWRPVYAALVVLLLMVALSLPYQVNKPVDNPASGFTESVQTASESADKVLLRFVFIDRQADSIEVAGDFSNWEPIPLTKQSVNGEQVWTGLVEMGRGEHQYMFVRNGEEWVTDPLAPVQKDDGFGNKNAVVYL